MGVYIAGMGLPNPNHSVLVEINSDGSVFAAYDGGRTRLIECSALYVPPHGRLIDADALEQDAQKRLLICNKNDNQFQKPYEVMRAIALTPTMKG